MVLSQQNEKVVQTGYSTIVSAYKTVLLELGYQDNDNGQEGLGECRKLEELWKAQILYHST